MFNYSYFDTLYPRDNYRLREVIFLWRIIIVMRHSWRKKIETLFSMILIILSILLIKNDLIPFGKAINKFRDIMLLMHFIAENDFLSKCIHLVSGNLTYKFKIEFKIKDEHEFYRSVLLQCQMV